MQTSTEESVTITLENFADRQVVRRAFELFVANEESSTAQRAALNALIAAIDTYPST